MEQRPELKSRGVSFNGKWRNTSLSRAFKHSTMKNQSFSSVDNQCLDTSRSPPHAMQFLCRSWSPSASDFQQLFSLNNNFFPPHTNDRTDEQEEMKVEETLENQAMRSTCIITNKEEKTWMDVKHMTGWLKGKSLTSFLRSHKEKKKEKARLHTAKLHAAISLTQLAAAIAGFATNCTAEAQGITHMTTGGGTLACDQDMGSVVASAAALLTTVCAEAAESLGAKRTRVASAVNSGLATQTPIDVITLTATAATCLRGAATLKSRGKAETYFPRNQELLKVGVQTLIIMPSGEKGFKWVRIHLKQRQLTLSFRNKYFGGALTTSKEYKIINVIEEIKEAKGSNFLSLKTNKGIIKLFFDDEKQSIIWISTISNMLQTCNSY